MLQGPWAAYLLFPNMSWEDTGPKNLTARRPCMLVWEKLAPHALARLWPRHIGKKGKNPSKLARYRILKKCEFVRIRAKSRIFFSFSISFYTAHTNPGEIFVLLRTNSSNFLCRIYRFLLDFIGPPKSREVTFLFVNIEFYSIYIIGGSPTF